MEYKQFTDYIKNTINDIYSKINDFFNDYINNSGNSQLTLAYSTTIQTSSEQNLSLESKISFNPHGGPTGKKHKASLKPGFKDHGNSKRKKQVHNKNNNNSKKSKSGRRK